MELRDFAPQVFSLHADGDFAGALRLVVNALPLLREDDAEIATFWRVCLEACSGSGEVALDELAGALDRGWWYGPEMLADGDLDPIRDEPRFQEILAASEAAQRAARHVIPEPIVTEPAGQVRGTVVALHAAEGRATHTSRIWSTAGTRGYRTIAVGSSHKVSSLRASWKSRSGVVTDVTAQLDSAVKPIILGGRSLGAAAALHLAATRAVPASGVILVAPTVRWELIRPAPPRPVVILAGAKDSERLRDQATQTAHFLRESGCPVDLHLVPRMSHYYPDDFESWLIPSIDWIEDQLVPDGARHGIEGSDDHLDEITFGPVGEAAIEDDR